MTGANHSRHDDMIQHLLTLLLKLKVISADMANLAIVSHIFAAGSNSYFVSRDPCPNCVIYKDKVT